MIKINRKLNLHSVYNKKNNFLIIRDMRNKSN